jgi:glutamyl-tRNA(Gln) amidotransferase subunit E
VVFVADTLENATDALKAIGRRAREAIDGVPEETRAANPDGTTRYMRPRPGAARMYPETDIPPIQLTPEDIEQLMPRLPELPEQKLSRLMKEFQINRKLASQVMNSEYASLFEKIAGEKKVSGTVVAVTLTETMKALRREGIATERVADERVEEIFHLISSGKTTKEAIPGIITWLSKHEEKTAAEAVEGLGLGVLTKRELDTIVDDAIEQNQNLVQEKGADAFGPLMGIIMKKVRGRAKAQSVSEALKRKLKSMTK